MSKTPNYDSKIKTILDALEPGERVCELTGEKWMMDEEEISWYKKFNVPPTQVSPYTRACLCFSWGVGCQWWWNKHPETSKPILSHVHPTTGYKVLPDKEWHDLDLSSQGREVDLSQPIAKQLYHLFLDTPLPAQRNTAVPERSIAITSLGDIDSYFVLGSKTRNSFFCTTTTEVENCAECYHVHHASNSLKVVHSSNIHKGVYVRESSECLDCAYIFDCRNCEHCFGATNKRNKKYLWFNEQLSEEEYNKRRSAVDLSKRSIFEEMKAKFYQLMIKDTVWPENFNEHAENCSGEYISDSTNCKRCFFARNAMNSEESSYMFHTGSEDVYSAHGMVGSSELYYTVTTINCRNIKFSITCSDSQNLEYCSTCFNCEDCFGCVGLKHKSYHIFNKAYQPDEYFILLDQIKCKMLDEGTYGNFLPAKWSYSYVPDSAARFFMHMEDELIDKLNIKKFDPKDDGALGELSDVEPVSADQIPDDINDVDVEQWAGKPIYDEKLGRPFAFLKPELLFYKKNGLFPPNNHFIQRIKDMYFGANGFSFSSAVCSECEKEIMVAKNIEFPERKFLCKACYLKYLEQYG